MGRLAELERGDGHQEEKDLIESAVATIRQICRNSGLEFALRVGAVVVHNFYGGDLDAWRARGPKTVSFRRLAEHPDLPLSSALLCRCVAIFELCDRLNAPSRWRRLGTSHLRLVVGLRSDAQEQLLAKANAEGWSVKTLEAQVLKQRKNEPSRGGRRPQSTLCKSLNRIREGLNQCQRTVGHDVQCMKGEDLKRTLQLLVETSDCIDRASHALAMLHADAREPPSLLAESPAANEGAPVDRAG